MNINLDDLRSSAQTAVLPRICGLYFLFKDTELVYIGKGADIYCRVRQHREGEIKEFDSWSYVEVDPETLAAAEQALIEEYKPKYNLQYIPERIIRPKPRRKYQDCGIRLLATQMDWPLELVEKFAIERQLRKTGKLAFRFYEEDEAALYEYMDKFLDDSAIEISNPQTPVTRT